MYDNEKDVLEDMSKDGVPLHSACVDAAFTKFLQPYEVTRERAALSLKPDHRYALYYNMNACSGEEANT